MSNEKQVRVRFAPSPTGHLHIGGLRTAFFNWLFARHTNGVYLLRIEDTDTQRNKQEYVDSILSSFMWSNIMPDEPIVIQSERLAEHKKLLQKLIKEGKAYRCYCTESEIVARYVKKHGNDLFVKYDSHCRTNQTHDVGLPYVIRFALPREQQAITFNDSIRGAMSFEMDQFDDFIIARSDGNPIYNFVVTADDAFMRITHVIRGEEHLPNTPRQILLLEACGFEVPQYAHLPLILGSSGEKLSKRDAAVSVVEYKDKGYLPDALLNYLVRLGWSHGDQELFTRDEMVSFFSLETVGKKGAIFDQQKLDWTNSVYLRAKDNQAILDYIEEFLMPDVIDRLSAFNQEQLTQLIGLYKERVAVVGELLNELIHFYDGPEQYNHADVMAFIDHNTPTYLAELTQILENSSSFGVEVIRQEIKNFCTARSIKLVQLAQPLRIALVGKAASPGIFELMAILGKQDTLARVRALLDYLESKK